MTSKFLVYEHSSNEVVFVKRDDISSFHPKFIDRNRYQVQVTVGDKSFAIKDCNSIEEARIWITEQIGLIEGDGNSKPATRNTDKP